LGVRAIIIKENKVVLVRQEKANGRDVYIFPGGGIEENKDIFSAVQREIKEETSLEIKIKKLLLC